MDHIMDVWRSVLGVVRSRLHATADQLRAANQLTPEQEAAIDAQMRQMDWRGDVF